MVRILVIEDDPNILKLLPSDLELEGYTVITAKDGMEGLDRARTVKPDLIILDIMLPKMNGYDICRTLRKDGSDTPIIMLTAKGQEADKVIGLDMGADDYVTKPFGGMELLARVKALLRRHKRQLDKMEKIKFDDVAINFKSMEALKKGKPIALTAKEFQILELLVRHRGEVVSRRQFLEEIWGYEDMPSTRTVDNQVLTLRQKLSPKDTEAYITTIHGIGYKFTG
jgi:DNA-binding response OmpR family regulator